MMILMFLVLADYLRQGRYEKIPETTDVYTNTETTLTCYKYRINTCLDYNQKAKYKWKFHAL